MATQEQKLLDEFVDTLSSDKIFVAYAKLQELKAAGAKSKFIQDALENEHQFEVKRCEDGYNHVKRLLDDVNSDDNWKLAKSKRGTTVHYRKEDGNPLITTKATILIPVDKKDLPQAFVKLVAIFAETDLMPIWFPNNLMHSNETVHEISLFSKFLHMKFHPPAIAPISKRDVVCLGQGYDLTETGELAITFQSVPVGEKYDGFEVFPPESKYTRIDIKGAYYLRAAEGGIIVKSLSMTDLKLNFIPTFVLNWIAENGPFDFVNAVLKRFVDFEDSDWEERVRRRPELYMDIQQRVASNMGITITEIHDSPGEQSEKPKQKSLKKKRLSSRKSQKLERKASDRKSSGGGRLSKIFKSRSRARIEGVNGAEASQHGEEREDREAEIQQVTSSKFDFNSIYLQLVLILDIFIATIVDIMRLGFGYFQGDSKTTRPRRK